MDLNQDPQEAAWCKELGVNYDDRTPKVEDSNEPVPLGRLKVVSAIVGDNVDSGRKVLLHCTEGRGRSPTCATAYLISSGMSVADAKNAVVGKRDVWTGPDQKSPGLLEEFGKIVEFARSGI
jgi:protein-tyrosine phosphatase